MSKLTLQCKICCPGILTHCTCASCCLSSDAYTSCHPHHSDVVPLGQLKSSFNYSTDDKRVLNFENVVDDADNIKQVTWVCSRETESV